MPIATFELVGNEFFRNGERKCSLAVTKSGKTTIMWEDDYDDHHPTWASAIGDLMSWARDHKHTNQEVHIKITI